MKASIAGRDRNRQLGILELLGERPPFGIVGLKPISQRDPHAIGHGRNGIPNIAKPTSHSRRSNPVYASEQLREIATDSLMSGRSVGHDLIDIRIIETLELFASDLQTRSSLICALIVAQASPRAERSRDGCTTNQATAKFGRHVKTPRFSSAARYECRGGGFNQFLEVDGRRCLTIVLWFVGSQDDG